MKKVFYLLSVVLITVLASCSGGYNQEKVDKLLEKADKGNLTESDYKEAIQQAKYGIDLLKDGLKKAKDPEKFQEENEKVIESTVGLMMIASLGTYDDQLPSSIKSEARELKSNWDELAKSVEKSGMDGEGF